MKRVMIFAAAATGAAVLGMAAGAAAQMPPYIAAQLKKVGPVLDRGVSSGLYTPLQRKPPYDGVRVVRDLKYGPDPKNNFDVFTPARAAKGLRPVVVFVHGGGFVAGDKAQGNRGEPSAFYDNVMLWAVAHDMVGVNFNYPLAPGALYPVVQEDLRDQIAWIRANIRKYGGDPNRIYLWGHSAGASHVASYVAETKFHGSEWAGVKGAILQSGPYEIGGATQAYYGADKARSPLPGLLATRLPLFVATAELDPPFAATSGESLRKQLCDAGRCPAGGVLKDHNHLSGAFHINTADESLTRDVEAFIVKNR